MNIYTFNHGLYLFFRCCDDNYETGVTYCYILLYIIRTHLNKAVYTRPRVTTSRPKNESVTDKPTDGPTDGRTGIHSLCSYTVASSRLKKDSLPSGHQQPFRAGVNHVAVSTFSSSFSLLSSCAHARAHRAARFCANTSENIVNQ